MKTAVIFHPRKDGEYSGFVFSEEWCQTAFLQFGYHFEENMRVPRGMQSLGSGFPIGARSIPVGTRLLHELAESQLGKSSVLYLLRRHEVA